MRVYSPRSGLVYRQSIGKPDRPAAGRLPVNRLGPSQKKPQPLVGLFHFTLHLSGFCPRLPASVAQLGGPATGTRPSLRKPSSRAAMRVEGLRGLKGFRGLGLLDWINPRIGAEAWTSRPMKGVPETDQIIAERGVLQRLKVRQRFVKRAPSGQFCPGYSPSFSAHHAADRFWRVGCLPPRVHQKTG